MLIAHITDTHIREPGECIVGNADPCDRLARCIDQINNLTPPPDAVLLTGDLVDNARASEYALLHELLNALTLPYWLIPGNHDSREGLCSAFPRLDELLADGDFIHYTVEDFPVRMIGLDTLVPGRPEGELCARRLQWLDARLAAQPHRATMLFMHHPPVKVGIPHLDAIRCRGGDALGDLLGRHRQVLHILCGHVHRPIQTHCNGVAVTVGPSPSHATPLDLVYQSTMRVADEPPAFGLLMLSDAGTAVSHIQYIGS